MNAPHPETTTITYRKATPADVPVLVKHRTLFATELAGAQPHSRTDQLKEQMTAYFEKATADNSCISFIASCGDETAGIGSVHLRDMPGNFKNPSGKWGYIMNMYTVPKFRRRGVCRNILNALVEEATKHGTTAFELHATEAGELVYRQEGFTLHPEPTYRKYS